jgi:hypothetical protein
MSTMVPDFLSHYYEAAAGPFSNLSMLPPEQAERILEGIRQRGDRFASQRAGETLQVRRGLEELVRKRFIERGGKPKLARPNTMIRDAIAGYSSGIWRTGGGDGKNADWTDYTDLNLDRGGLIKKKPKKIINVSVEYFFPLSHDDVNTQSIRIAMGNELLRRTAATTKAPA